ncbi:hypothetical protein L7F22_053408, partial [Adiantum nelumboides]|nr:hypothetical protein [Adiantum nelumboides]
MLGHGDPILMDHEGVMTTLKSRLMHPCFTHLDGGADNFDVLVMDRLVEVMHAYNV